MGGTSSARMRMTESLQRKQEEKGTLPTPRLRLRGATHHGTEAPEGTEKALELVKP